MNGEKVKVSAFLVQGLATLSISLLTTLTALIYSWPSYTMDNFKSNETVLSAPLTSLEVSLLGSLTNVGGLIATPFCGYALNTFGRKYSAMLFGLPFVVAWGVIAFTSYVPLVLVAVGFAGLGAAGQAAATVYIAEISHDSIRGTMTSTICISYYSGVLVSYIWGGLLNYHQVVYIHLLLSVVYILLIITLKESPVFLLQRGKEEEAARAIAFYRQENVSSKVVEMEISKIKMQLNPILIEDDVKASESLINNELKVNELRTDSEWKFLIKSESSKRALIVCFIIMIVKTFMGVIVLQVYAEPLFREAVPSMKPNQCAILLAIDFLVASVFCSLLMDKLGRKFLMTSTSVASGICTLLLGTQLQLHWASHWCSAFLIYGFSFVYTVGAGTVPFVVTAEVFLPEVRGLCNSIIMSCMWIMNFITLFIFKPLVDMLGLGLVFYCFSAFCFAGAIYSQLYLPETKGLSADAIQPLFLNRRNR